MVYYITDIQNMYNSICKNYNKLRVKVQWMEEHHVDYTSALGVYYRSTLPNIIYLRKPNELNNISLSTAHTAFYSMSISKFEYVMYHELFHHISGLKDGEYFEDRLIEFINENRR